MKIRIKESEVGAEVQFDTIVCPADEDGFREAYIKKNAWWEVRLSKEKRESLKYVAIYETSPVAAIRNIAEIDKIVPYGDTKRFILHLKNKRHVTPIQLDRNKRNTAPQGPRYTSYKKIIKAKNLSDLW